MNYCLWETYDLSLCRPLARTSTDAQSGSITRSLSLEEEEEEEAVPVDLEADSVEVPLEALVVPRAVLVDLPEEVSVDLPEEVLVAAAVVVTPLPPSHFSLEVFLSTLRSPLLRLVCLLCCW